MENIYSVPFSKHCDIYFPNSPNLLITDVSGIIEKCKGVIKARAVKGNFGFGIFAI